MPPICFLDSTRSSYAIQPCLVTVFEVNSLNLLVFQLFEVPKTIIIASPLLNVCNYHAQLIRRQGIFMHD